MPKTPRLGLDKILESDLVGELRLALGRLVRRLNANADALDSYAQSVDAHAHTGADGYPRVSHTNLLNVTADQHHPQLHAVSHSPGGGDDISGSYVARNLVSAKGDLLAGTGAAALARLAVGTRGQLLLPNSATTTGLEWASRFVGVNASLTLANGDNNNVSTPEALTVLISGPTAPFSITGLTNGESGRVLVLINTTSQPMTLRHESTLSTAGNRILTPAGVDITAKTAVLVYDGTSSRWRVVSYEPHTRVLSSKVGSGTTFKVTIQEGSGYHVILSTSVSIPAGHRATICANSAVRASSQVATAIAIGGSAGIWVYTDSNAVIANSHVVSGLSGTVTVELRAIKAPGAPDKSVERRELAVMAVIE